MTTFLKPEINFPMFPAVYMYIEHAYKGVETYTDFVDFVNGCLDEAETTKNEVRKQAYTTIASCLYGIDTNVSYESKGIELIVQKL